MPRYFFHVATGEDLFRDKDGCLYLDLGSAKVYARRLARELRQTQNFKSASVLLVNEDGGEVVRVEVDEFAERADSRALPVMRPRDLW